jgi:hypothetical protein
VAPPGSPIEIVERRIKSPAVLSEDDPHPHDEVCLQVARAVDVHDQSLADRRVSRLLQHQPQVEAAAHQRRAAHLVSHERASTLEVTEIVHGVLGRGRDAGGDVDEHLLWNDGEGSRRRHRPPSDERRAKEVLVGMVDDKKWARAQWRQRDEAKREERRRDVLGEVGRKAKGRGGCSAS